MAKLSILSALVSSLTKAEKRYFTLYARLQSGSKDYMILFGLLRKGLPAKELKAAFSKKMPRTSIGPLANYLYKVLLDALLQLRLQEKGSARLTATLLKARILFERSLFEEGFRQLELVRLGAAEAGDHGLQLCAGRLELQQLAKMSFLSLDEGQLADKQMKLEALIRTAQTVHLHSALYERLLFRNLHQGSVRTQLQKDGLNDLVLSELHLFSDRGHQTYESRRTHLLFAAHYCIAVGNYPSALQSFCELEQLLEAHRSSWKHHPADYIIMIEGMLDSLHGIGQYAEMDHFLQKIEKIESTTIHLRVMVQRILFIYRSIRLVQGGAFEDAVALKKSFEQPLFDRLVHLDAGRQADVLLYAAIPHFCLGQSGRAHRYLNKVLTDSRPFYHLPLYRTVRLIHLLVHYEMGNHELVAHGIRSLKRQLRSGEQNNYQLENLLFKFLALPLGKMNLRQRTQRWTIIKKSIEPVEADKFERQLLKIFDFPTWIEATLTKKKYADLVREKQRIANPISFMKENVCQ